MNNWSVHQPARPHANGMAGNEDLGQDITVDGVPIHYGQKGHKGIWDDEEYPRVKVNGAKGMKGDEELGLHMNVNGDRVHVA